MPAYDIDSDQGEVDEVYFNGHKIGTLQGSDGTWQENEFTIPIEWVKFPTAKGSAITGQMQPPVAAENEIQINIDTKGEGWCASIDWAEIRLKAMAPLVLIHGIGANPQADWEEKPGVAKELASMGIPFEHRIEIGPNNTIFSRVDDKDKVIEGNATLLEREIYRIATSFGVQKVHIVGHSKGGLDSRGYLARNYHPEKVKVLSLYTLSSPHHGSVLADISVLARDKNLRLVEGGSVEAQEGDSEMKIFLKADSLLVFTAGGPQLPGLRDLQTNSAKDFNRETSIPDTVKFYTCGADADLDGDGNISDVEADPFFPPNIPFVFNRSEAATTAYHLLRDVSTVRFLVGTRERLNIFPFPPTQEDVNEVVRVRTTKQINDLAVTDTSSKLGNEQHFGPNRNDPSKLWLQKNHRNFKNPETMDKVLERIRTDFPVQ